MQRYSEMKFTDVCNLDGVKDIQPAMAKGKFAQALMAEDKGDRDGANAKLAEAVALV